MSWNKFSRLQNFTPHCPFIKSLYFLAQVSRFISITTCRYPKVWVINAHNEQLNTNTWLVLDTRQVTQYSGDVNLLEICIDNLNTYKVFVQQQSISWLVNPYGLSQIHCFGISNKKFRRKEFRIYLNNESGHIDPCMWNNNHHFDERSLSRPFLLLYALIANYVFHTVKTDPSILNEWVKCHHNGSIPDDYPFSSHLT